MVMQKESVEVRRILKGKKKTSCGPSTLPAWRCSVKKGQKSTQTPLTNQLNISAPGPHSLFAKLSPVFHMVFQRFLLSRLAVPDLLQPLTSIVRAPDAESPPAYVPNHPSLPQLTDSPYAFHHSSIRLTPTPRMTDQPSALDYCPRLCLGLLTCLLSLSFCEWPCPAWQVAILISNSPATMTADLFRK